MAVLHLLTERILQSGLVRFARLGSVSIALTYGVAMLVLHLSDARVLMSAVAVRAIVVLSWLIAAPVALVAARNVVPAAPDGFDALARSRGIDPRENELVVLGAIVLALMKSLGIPAGALALVSVALAPSVNAALWAIAFVVGVLGYLLLLSGTLAAVCRACVRLAPVRARELLLFLVLGPYAASIAFPNLPSLPAAFSAVLDVLLKLGAMAK